MNFFLKPILLAIIFVTLASCALRQGGSYRVKPGDTLYSIAWRYGLDYKQLAGWNRIAVNSIIKPGQRLKLRPGARPPVVAATKSSGPAQVAKTRQPAEKTQVKVKGADTGQWLWPVNGAILNTFSASKLDRRGIDIAGRLGQSVRATAGGKVVYSGNGLSGYGNLIIIKHSDSYLSAYAYCQQRLVKEGTQVSAGSVIAKMGQHKTSTARLHFEIRKNGEPVDPTKYLPKR